MGQSKANIPNQDLYDELIEEGVQKVSKLSILRQAQHDNLLLINMSH